MQRCLAYSMGGDPIGLDWCAVAERLKLHGLWDRDVESKLAICEIALLGVHYELRKKDGTNP